MRITNASPRNHSVNSTGRRDWSQLADNSNGEHEPLLEEGLSNNLVGNFPFLEKDIHIKLPNPNDDMLPTTKEIPVRFFRPAAPFFDRVFKDKSEEVLGDFQRFINSNYSSENNGASTSKGLHPNYLQYLLPLITQYTQCSEQQYKAIDDFLMPIWKFNQITAKGKMCKEGIKKYIEAIIRYSPETIDPNVQQNVQEMHTVFKWVCTIDRLIKNIQEMQAVFMWACTLSPNNGDSPEHLVSCLEDEMSDDAKSCYETLPYVGQLFVDFFRGCILEKASNLEDEMSDDAKPCYETLPYVGQLFVDFFRGCIFEKNSKKINHRINSGGCKLMVVAVAHKLGVLDQDLDLSLKANDAFKNLLDLQGEANVVLNDGISLFKEYEEREKSRYQVLKEYGGKKADVWLTEIIENYHNIMETFSFEQSFFLNGILIDQPNDQNFLFNLCLLNTAALSGVPLWSCFLTHRYKLLPDSDVGIEINQICDLITNGDNKESHEEICDYEITNQPELLKKIMPILVGFYSVIGSLSPRKHIILMLGILKIPPLISGEFYLHE